MSDADALRLTGVSKRFGGVRALHEVQLAVPRGEVHGLAGANGSGKSTLVKILAGYHAPDEGAVWIWGEEVPFPIQRPHDHGIAAIHQDLGLVDTLSITENVVQTTQFGTSAGRPIHWRAQRARVHVLLERLGIGLDPTTEIATLTRGERTLVAIARAICEIEASGREGALLIMDEPTAALSEAESGAVYDLLRRVAQEGGAALFISHHVQEMRSVCDCVSVLRDGELVAQLRSDTSSERDIVRAMLGEELASETPLEASEHPAATVGAGPAVLRVADLQTEVLQSLSFDVAPGEIVGITGLLGMGQDELPYLLAGARKPHGGTIEIDGRVVPAGDIDAAMRDGVVLVPAERRRDGLWMEANASENLGIAAIRRYWHGGRYRRGSERAAARTLARRFGVRPPNPETLVSTLSGGNQQKVLLAKWLQLEPRVVLLHEPTQGVDVGAKLEIHQTVREFARRTGAAVVVFSSDHVETAELCDRVLVLWRGRIAGRLKPPELSTHRIVELANSGTAA